jgi:hypothetical protein
MFSFWLTVCVQAKCEPEINCVWAPNWTANIHYFSNPNAHRKSDMFRKSSVTKNQAVWAQNSARTMGFCMFVPQTREFFPAKLTANILHVSASLEAWTFLEFKSQRGFKNQLCSAHFWAGSESCAKQNTCLEVMFRAQKSINPRSVCVVIYADPHSSVNSCAYYAQLFVDMRR